jgi:hypothetical protein
MPYIEKLGVSKVKEQIWQYEIKFAVDRALAQCPEYSGETEWLDEQRVDRALEKLQNGKKY